MELCQFIIYIMKKGRFEVIKESKFDQLSKKQMQESKGGWICISCKKRTRKVPIVIGVDPSGGTVKG